MSAQTAATPASSGSRRYEVLGIVSAAATALLALSLWSYDASGGENWIGPVGEWLADLVASAFGLAAWVVPVELGLLTLRLFLGRPSPVGLAHFASTLVLVLIGCAMAHLAMPEQVVLGGHLPGGLIGEVLGEILRSLLGLVGAFVIGIAVILVTLVLRTSFSVVDVTRAAYDWFVSTSTALREWAHAVWEAWQEAREIERREREDEEARNAPRIVGYGALLAEIEGDDAAPDAVVTPPAPTAASASPEGPVKRGKKKRGAKNDPPPLEAEIVGVGDEPDAAIDDEPELDDVEDDEPEEVDPRAATQHANPNSRTANAKGSTTGAVNVAPARMALASYTSASNASAVKVVAPARPAGPTIVPPTADSLKQTPTEAIEHSCAFELPPSQLLEAAPPQPLEVDATTLRDNAARLSQKLEAYGVRGRVDEIHPGPVVTMYELEPESGTKVSKIASLSDDLAMALAAQKVRIVAPIPGKARVGFELPNKHRQTVFLRDIVEDRRWEETAKKAALPVAFGKDIAGQPVYGDLAKMPHLLVAGATGSGKSVGLNVMLVSLLMKRTPEEVRMLMIDPKVVELAVFDGIPHMLLPVVTDMKKASLALRWAVDEMEHRYQLFADAGARNIGSYNERVEKVLRGELAPEKLAPRKHKKQRAIGPDGEEVLVDPVDGEGADAIPMPNKLPYVVVVVDEFADLMMVAAKDVEAAIARLAQKARAAGIHVILATQRPSVDVITGMIKANFPARIAFKVSQREDSKTILGRNGAEHLLGYGDMLMIPPGSSDLRRVHSAFVSENEVQVVCDHLREQGDPIYDERILAPRDEESGEPVGGESGSEDPLYDRAVACVANAGYCSISHIQRQLGIGYNKAAKLVEKMEAEGVVGPASGKAGGRREVLISAL